MPFAFLCHAPADDADARSLAGWLERNSSWEIRLAECGAGASVDLVEAAEQSMSADAAILLLSRAAVPAWPPRARWEPVLLVQPVEAGVGLACVMLAECNVPGLLRRRECFPASLEGRRALRRWLVGRCPRTVWMPGLAPQAAVEEQEIEELRRSLADEPGEAHDVPAGTALALALQCRDEFECVLWVNGARLTAAGVYGELARGAELRLSGQAAENAARLASWCGSRRTLVVLDDCPQAAFVREGKCSVVRTAPHPHSGPLPLDRLSALFGSWTRREDECLSGLRDVPAAVREAAWSEARGIAYAAASLLRGYSRAAELLELVEIALPRAASEGDEAAVRYFDWERAWILQAWGREEAAEAPIVPVAPGDQLTLPFALEFD